jgi:hypothetical protein
MGVAASDYDADGDVDIFVTNFAADTNTLYWNMGALLFRGVTASARGFPFRRGGRPTAG